MIAFFHLTKTALFCTFCPLIVQIYWNYTEQPYWIGLNDRNVDGKFCWLDEEEKVSVWFTELMSFTNYDNEL